MTKIDEISRVDMLIGDLVYAADEDVDIIRHNLKYAIKAQRKADIEKAVMLGLGKTLSATFVQDIQKEILGEDA